ncbi:MAG TPA: sigma 54-interacting transcriptional regulator, partial [Longimicrobiales bacterium]
MRHETIFAIQLSESFAQLLTEQARSRELELVLQPAMDMTEVTRAAAVLIVAAGVEEEATSLIPEIAALTSAPVVVVGAGVEHPLVVSLVRAGAYDYFALPGDVERLSVWLDEVARRQQAHVDAATLAEQERASYDFSRMIGESPELKAALQRAARIIPRGDATVLITGETGTGKELLAQAIHYNSPRARRPIVEVNCTALPA